MEVRINWVEDVMFVAESETGHSVVLDGAPESGGRNMGMRPMELMALSVGSCSSYDVVTILRKARQQIPRRNRYKRRIQRGLEVQRMGDEGCAAQDRDRSKGFEEKTGHSCEKG